jgi:DNA (cytosine-5)-methyltransferase 1
MRVGSDFSGVGAFNQAIMRLGVQFEEVFVCDMDKYARETFIHNYGEPKYYPTNVYEREIPTESLDIYMTSPPCQAFSSAGKRLGKEDKRGILFFNSHEFIQVNKPRFFIFENVRGLLSDDGGRTFQEWLNMLGGKSVNGVPVLFPYEESVPYHLYWQVLNAKNHGVPQNRERVFLVGIRDDQDNKFQFPREEHLTKRLKDVLEDAVDDKYFLNYETINEIFVDNLKVKSATSKGYEEANDGDSINFKNINSETRRGRVGKGVAQTIESNNMSQGIVFSDKRLNKTISKNNFKIGEPKGIDIYNQTIHDECPTLKDPCHNDRRLFDGCKIRKFTPRECFRLMDFPDTFTWKVSDSQAYKQAGNSIVVNVLYKILKQLPL